MKLPIEAYIAVRTRTRYLAAAAPSLPGFEPDGQNSAFMIALPALAQGAFDTLLGKFNPMNVLNGALSTSFAACHDCGVTVHASLKSSYRKDPNSSRAISYLPKIDRTPERTLARMKGIAALWPTLPNVPGTNGPLKVGGLTAAAFATMATTFDTTVTSAGLANAEYAGTLAEFHQKMADWDGFVSSALVQGRALYKPGTAQRALIDRVPTAADTVAPEGVTFTSVVSPAAGEVHLAFEADHATSFQVWHKGPGAEQFTQVGDVLKPGEYEATGLPAGTHEYQVVGVNSRGEGPASAVQSLTVAAAQVA